MSNEDMTPHSLAVALSHDGKPSGTGDTYKIRCILPTNHKHGDKNPSFEVTRNGKGKISWQCYGGCDWKDVTAEITRRGLNPYAKKAKKEKSEDEFKPWEHDTTDEFEYRQADDTWKYNKKRYFWNGEKHMVFWHANQKGGWKRSCENLLYNLPEVAKAAAAGDIAVLTEGETDIKYCLKEWGYPAFSLDNGCKSLWSDRYAEDVRGLSAIYICHDNDKPGYEYANRMAGEFTKAGFECFWVDLPGIESLEPGADVRDWKNAGHTKDEFFDAITNAPLWTKEIPCPEYLIEHHEVLTGKKRPDAPAGKSTDFIAETQQPKAKKPAKEFKLVGGSSQLLWTDNALGRYVVDDHGPNIWYAELHGWFCWDGIRFKFDPEALAVGSLAQETSERVTSILENAPMAPSDRDKAIKYVQSCSGQSNMVKKARGQRICQADHFDANPDILNTVGGVLDLRDGTLHQHNRDFMCSQLISPGVLYEERKLVLPEKFDPLKFDPAAGTEFKCPRFVQFLREIFADDEDMIAFMLRALGYSITGDTKEHKVFFCYGGGRNGKSKLLKLMLWLLGDYARSGQVEMWMKKQQRDHAESFIHLIGKRMVISGEVKQNDRLDEGRVKDFSGEDMITTRALRHNENIYFEPVGKLWLYGNHKPYISDSTHSIWDRMLLIPFEVKFEGSRADKNLEMKLKREASGILQLLTFYSMVFRKFGLLVPDKVKKAGEEYKSEMDTPEHFMSQVFNRDEESGEFTIRHIDGRQVGERAADCNLVYQAWAKENGIKFPKSSNQFFETLKDYKIPQRKTDGWYYALDIKEDWRPPERSADSRYGGRRRFNGYDNQLYINQN